MNIDSIGGRKFLLTILILGVGTFVQLKSGMNAEYAAFLAGILAAFSASNAYVTTKMTPVDAPTTASNVNPDILLEVASENARIMQRLDGLEATLSSGMQEGQKATELLETVRKTAENAGKVAAAAMAVAQGRQ